MAFVDFSFLRNPFFIAYAVLYTVMAVLLVTVENYPLADILIVLVLVGILFPLVAHLLSRAARPFPLSVRPGGQEMWLLSLTIVAAAIYLTFGFNSADRLLAGFLGQSELHLLVGTALKKLVFFVAVPLILFAGIFKYSLRDFGLQFDGKAWRSHVPVLAGTAVMLMLFQYFVGAEARPLREGEFTPSQLVVGMPIVFLWLALEVGLVEEFFFRALIQSRLSAYFRSETAGIVLACLIFGLAHAPGLYLRGAEGISPTGGSPSLLLSIGYSVVTLSVAGFFLGIIWSRTRNLLLVVFIHAAGDLLPNFAKLAGTLGIIKLG